MKSLTVIAKRDQILGSYNAYLDQIGVMDNPAVKQALAEATDPRFKDFFKLIMRPNNAKFTPASYAKACNIEQAEFNQWWQKASVQRAIGVCQMQSPIIAEHMAADALTKPDICERCDGYGFVTADAGLESEKVAGYRAIRAMEHDDDGIVTELMRWVRDCPKCGATGKVKVIGDSDSRKLVMEMAGLSGKKSGLQIIQNFGGAGPSSAIARMNDTMTIDAEIVEEE
jgi:hypothetical protein